jgi:guanosine-3',5'-bis(diphosphate) 3'-pyrophosphohydrolase
MKLPRKGTPLTGNTKPAGQAASETALEQWINKVREMLETNDSNALEFMDEFRKNLFVEEVFVFTPKGDLIILPDKSTTLDFAFDIHTQIGMQCLGAKVNQKLVPLSYQLKNGDQVEILNFPETAAYRRMAEICNYF